jgi:replicative DNA helicase
MTRFAYRAPDLEAAGLPIAAETLDARIRHLGLGIMHTALLWLDLVPQAVGAGVKADMLPVPWLWRKVIEAHEAGVEEFDLQALRFEIKAMDGESRAKFWAVVQAEQEAHLASQPMRPHFSARCRELVECYRWRDLGHAHAAVAAAIEAQEAGRLTEATAQRDAAQAAWEATQEPEEAWADVVAATIEDATSTEPPTGIATGIRCLDDHLGPIGPGWLVVIMAPPKGGKTALALNTIAAAELEKGGRVAMVSLEMPAKQVSQRLMARESGVPVRAMAARDLTSWQQGALSRAADVVSRYDLTVVTTSTTMDAIAARLRTLHKAKPLTLAVIDYAQLIANGVKERHLDIEATTRGAKLLALELSIPVLLLSQPNNTDAKEGKLSLFSGKGSGSIAADADLVLIPERDKDDPSKAGIAIAGGRHGEPRTWPLGTLRFDGAKMLFREA